ncbi:transposase [Desulfococcaceae bacterium OttesenSCG-928-F15]|nr:transposase [Desulfococcaceae bacterium OttesenSCG-928-F15]
MSDFLPEDSQGMNSSDPVPLITDAGIDDLPPDHPVHVLLGIVADLDLKEMEKKAQESLNPMLLPRMLLTLLYYGFLSGISSSEELAKTVHKSGALQCITGGLFPTPAELDRFRRLFSEKISSLFYEISLMMLLSDTCKSYDCSFNKIEDHHESQAFREKLKSQIAEWLSSLENAKVMQAHLVKEHLAINEIGRSASEEEKRTGDGWQQPEENINKIVLILALFRYLLAPFHFLIVAFTLAFLAASHSGGGGMGAIVILIMIPAAIPSAFHLLSFTRIFLFRFLSILSCGIITIAALVLSIISYGDELSEVGVWFVGFYGFSTITLLVGLRYDWHEMKNKKVEKQKAHV